jgi:hypothetical protein
VGFLAGTASIIDHFLLPAVTKRRNALAAPFFDRLVEASGQKPSKGCEYCPATNTRFYCIDFGVVICACSTRIASTGWRT